MHAAGLHSALAIKRQRKRRDEQRRAKERRYSLQSSESGLTSPRGSQASLERTGSHRRGRKNRPPPHAMLDSKVVSSLGMFHLGVVFVVIGLLLLGSWAMVGGHRLWSELIITGVIAIIIGIFLIVLNKYISTNEERELEEYVQSQLTRSRSGHRLERDVETGGMISKHQKREKRLQKEDEERGLNAIEIESPPVTPGSPLTVNTASHHGFINPAAVNGDAVHEHHLDQIVEEDYSTSDRCEDESKRADHYNKETYSNHSTTISMSPVTPSDTRELIGNGRHMIMSRM